MSKQSSSSEDGSLNIAFFSVLIVSLFLLFIFSEGEALPKEGKNEMAILSSTEDSLKEKLKVDDIALYNETSLLAQSTPTYHEPQVLATKQTESVQRRSVRLTAYAPLDPGAQEGMCFSGDPMITASGTYVRDGIVAANFLSFGTEIRIPSLFGDKIFVVEDRMSSRFTNTIDVLVSSKKEALNFGIKNAHIEILN